MWVKICGIVDSQTAGSAVAAGANAIGLVFDSSPRCLGIDDAIELIGQLDQRPEIVAVTKNPGRNEVANIVAAIEPDYVQADAVAWREQLSGLRLPSWCSPLPVFRNQMPDKSSLGPCLFESNHSGQGARANWELAASASRQRTLILAGGLNLANVGEAIRRVNPRGIDVSSGVEIAPGKKCPVMIKEFIDAVKYATERQLPGQNNGA